MSGMLLNSYVFASGGAPSGPLTVDYLLVSGGGGGGAR
jgi:hypothetical protein